MGGFTMTAGAIMAKKKSGEDLKLTAVKIDRVIASKAKMIAADQGKSLAGYLSEGLRGLVERDWAKMVKRADKGSAE
jgi:hypothetical protein